VTTKACAGSEAVTWRERLHLFIRSLQQNLKHALAALNQSARRGGLDYGTGLSYGDPQQHFSGLQSVDLQL